MELTNVFITGAATGIGRATAEKFYNMGWSVGLVDINLEMLQDYTASWDQTRVFCANVDVTDADQIQQALTQFCKPHEGRLRLLHNNAGIMQLAPFESLDLATHKRTIDVNVMGTINTLMSAFPFLRAAENATVINMASASTMYGIPMFSSYAASKSAVKSLTESLQIEWKTYGIHVCDMMPPFVATGLVNEQSVKPAIIERMGVDLGPEDVANAIVKQVETQRTHIPVSKKFSALYYLSDLMPYFLRKPAINFLSRPDRGRLDRVQRVICALTRSGPAMHKLPVPMMRKTYQCLEKAFGLPKNEEVSADCFQIPVPTATRKKGEMTEIPARIYKPLLSGKAPTSTLVFFHGGGCVIGDLNTHDAFCRYLAQEAGINVISVAYRLSPEVTFPEPICDAIDAWNWIDRNRKELDIADHKIGVGGDSFGGYLAAMCSTPSLQTELPIDVMHRPDYQLLLYPIFDYRGITASVQQHGKGLLFTTEALHVFRSHLFNNAEEVHRKDASVILHEQVAETVPTLLYSAEFDLLRDDSFAYAKKLTNQGITLKHVHWEDATHGLIHMGRFSKKVQAHLQSLCGDINTFVQALEAPPKAEANKDTEQNPEQATTA